MSLGTAEAVKRAVMAGVGVALLSRASVAEEVQAAGNLVVLPVTDMTLRRPLYQLRARDRYQGILLRRFLWTLQEMLGAPS